VADVVPGYEASDWWGIAASKATPTEIVREVCQCESGNGHIATGALGYPLWGRSGHTSLAPPNRADIGQTEIPQHRIGCSRGFVSARLDSNYSGLPQGLPVPPGGRLIVREFQASISTEGDPL
jgi:hypothetical protein